jgi:hypothetical protein
MWDLVESAPVTWSPRSLFEGFEEPWLGAVTELDDEVLPTGGKGGFTQGVHCEYIVVSEAICPQFTHWVFFGFF